MQTWGKSHAGTWGILPWFPCRDGAEKQVLSAGLGAYADSRAWQEAVEVLAQALAKVTQGTPIIIVNGWALHKSPTVKPVAYHTQLPTLMQKRIQQTFFCQIELLVPRAEAGNAESVWWLRRRSATS